MEMRDLKVMLYGFWLVVLGALVLTSCGESRNNSTTESTREGIFVDSLVVGLQYRSAAKTGVTGANGEYTYIEGETITFSLGNVVLGKAMAKPLMTPLDLVPEAVDESHSAVVNIQLDSHLPG